MELNCLYLFDYRGATEVSEMIGKTALSVRVIDAAEMEFVFDDGTCYKFYHEQDCCETVRVDDVCGDLSSLVGTPLLISRQDDNVPELSRNKLMDPDDEYDVRSFRWTFYNFATVKGYVTVKWYGYSNGYSERVDLIKGKWTNPQIRIN